LLLFRTDKPKEVHRAHDRSLELSEAQTGDQSPLRVLRRGRVCERLQDIDPLVLCAHKSLKSVYLVTRRFNVSATIVLQLHLS
jgi:hypothetical protein